ncbi:uncharacterized protein LOC136079317 [Hydra vulgaris]|uniref:uncharacterized protein LOC136079317 n=1 Tax=Hydra vulgaris TaxID=6087 RepID=UPI0032EA09D2
MVNKCCVVNCRSNYHNYGEVSTVVFSFPKNEELKKYWIKFVNRKDWTPTNSSVICIKHFEKKYYKKGNKNQRFRLIKNLKPIPTIFDCTNLTEEGSLQLIKSSNSLRKSPTKRIFQPDQYEQFLLNDLINSFNDITESFAPDGFSFLKYDDHVIFYKLSHSTLSIPEVTECIRVNNEMHVEFFYRGSPLPLPQWFCQGRDCRLSCKSMLHNFPTYIKSQAEQFSSVLTELQQIKYMKKPICSANIIRYSLILRYTSMQSYQLLREELPLPSLSLLKKITSGNIDALSCAKRLKLEGKISQDICLIFDEMYLQKCEEYFAGEMIGSDESGEMYKGIVCFMIIGLKQNIPYVIKTSPEKTINAEWLKEEIFECLRILTECEFNVRVIVCDNHSANVSCFKKILCASNQQAEGLFFIYNLKKIYLCFDVAHLIKNIRNNLLNCKRFLFPDFNFNGFKDPLIVCGGEIKWSTFHNIYEKDLTLDAGLLKAPKITMKVLHPGNFKQNVSLALAIFDETTSAAIHSYFPDLKSSADFLTLFNKW